MEGGHLFDSVGAVDVEGLHDGWCGEEVLDPGRSFIVGCEEEGIENVTSIVAFREAEVETVGGEDAHCVGDGLGVSFTVDDDHFHHRD